MDRRRLPWLLIISWVVITAIGAALSFPWMPIFKDEIRALTHMGNFAYSAMCIGGMMTGLFSGTITGVGQGLLLKRLLPMAKLHTPWCLATMLGLAAGWAVGGLLTLIVVFAIDFPPSEALVEGVGPPMIDDAIIRGAIVGACVGLVSASCQWFVLRTWIRRAYLWILSSMIGWIVAGMLFHVVYFAMGGPVLNPNDFPQPIEPISWAEYYAAKEPAELASKLVGGLAVGVIIGIAAIAMLRGVRQKAEEQPPSIST